MSIQLNITHLNYYITYQLKNAENIGLLTSKAIYGATGDDILAAIEVTESPSVLMHVGYTSVE